MNINYIIAKDLNCVKSELKNILLQEVKKSYVKTLWDNNQLLIKIEKMGLSEICLELKTQGDSVCIQEIKRKIALMHKPFAAEVEKMVEDILGNKLGAKKV